MLFAETAGDCHYKPHLSKEPEFVNSLAFPGIMTATPFICPTKVSPMTFVLINDFSFVRYSIFTVLLFFKMQASNWQMEKPRAYG